MNIFNVVMNVVIVYTYCCKMNVVTLLIQHFSIQIFSAQVRSHTKMSTQLEARLLLSSHQKRQRSRSGHRLWVTVQQPCCCHCQNLKAMVIIFKFLHLICMLLLFLVQWTSCFSTCNCIKYCWKGTQLKLKYEIRCTHSLTIKLAWMWFQFF